MKAGAAILFACWPAIAWGQLEILPDDPPQSVFSGEARKLRVLFRNPTAQSLEINLRTRLYQASSATLMPVGAAQPWKHLTLLAGQTVVESLTQDFPAVRAETRFRVHWLDDRSQALGKIDVNVFPDNFLCGLTNRIGAEPLGVFDPDDLLKPILTRLKVPFHDLLAGAGFDGFHGKLAIVGPFASEASVPTSLARRVTAKAKEASAIVWIQPPGPRAAEIFPPAYVVRARSGAVVVVHPSLLTDLANSPRAQLDLLRCIDLAQHPELVRLPEATH